MKPDIFSRSYENLDQELKNACLKYEHVQQRKGLKIKHIKLVFTPDAEPYFDIQVEEVARVKPVRQPKEPVVVVKEERKPCVHTIKLCNGLGREECLECEVDLGTCSTENYERCADTADAPDTPTLTSARFPVTDDDDDEDDRSLE